MIAFLLYIACSGAGISYVDYDATVASQSKVEHYVGPWAHGALLPATGEKRVVHEAISPVEVGILNRNPQSQGFWDTPPDVRVCASAPVTRRRVDISLDFWRNLGYTFNKIYYNDISIYCIGDVFSYNIITIDLIDGSHQEPALATTTTWIDRESRVILKAKVVLKSEWANTERLLEHELGHALGWLDYSQMGHIMHHEWSLGGLNTAGVEFQ